MAKKRKYAEPVMTNSAAIRVLYDLAGGRAKTWPALARDLDINVDDIYKRNRPWPSDFGRLRYRDAFRKYADEVHTSPYATILAVRRSLQESEAYTDEVRAIVEGVRADSDERAIANSLDRLLDTIVETARPYNEVPLKCLLGCDNQMGREDAFATDKASASNVGAAASRPSIPCAPAGARPDSGVPAAPVPCAAAVPRAEGGEPPAPAPARLRALTLRLLAACLSDGTMDGLPWHEAIAQPAAPADPLAPRAAAPVARQAVWGLAPDAERLVGAFAPPRVLGVLADAGALDAAADGALDRPIADALVAELCGDAGLGCRTMLRSCARLVETADADALFGNAAYLFDRLTPLAAQDGTGPAFEDARRFYLRFGDGDAARCLFALALLALLGPLGMRRVTACPSTRTLFER